MRFWENLSRELDSRGISLRTLAKAIGVTPGAVSNYSRGALPGLDVAAKIAEHLNVSLDALVWGHEGKSTPSICPSPHEHALLKELSEEFGLQEVILLSSLSSQNIPWRIAQALLDAMPAPLPLSALQEVAMADDAHLVKASLALLKRQKVVEEVAVGTERGYRFRPGAAQFRVNEIGDRTQHIKLGIRLLFERVLPRLLATDPHSHMTTVTAKVPRDFAEKVSAELDAYIRNKGKEIVVPDGSTDLSMLFAIAVNDDMD